MYLLFGGSDMYIYIYIMCRYVHICKYVCKYVHICMCIYVYTCVYIYIETYYVDRITYSKDFVEMPARTFATSKTTRRKGILIYR